MAPITTPASLFLNNDLSFTSDIFTGPSSDQLIEQPPPGCIFGADFWRVPLVICAIIYVLLCLFGLWSEIRQRDHGDTTPVCLARGQLWYHQEGESEPQREGKIPRTVTHNPDTRHFETEKHHTNLL